LVNGVCGAGRAEEPVAVGGAMGASGDSGAALTHAGMAPAEATAEEPALSHAFPIDRLNVDAGLAILKV